MITTTLDLRCDKCKERAYVLVSPAEESPKLNEDGNIPGALACSGCMFSAVNPVDQGEGVRMRRVKVIEGAIHGN